MGLFLFQAKKYSSDPLGRGPSGKTTSPCSRFSPGSRVEQPEALFSENGILRLNLSYQKSVDPTGGNNPLYCYVLPDGKQSPTLHLNPGDQLVLTLKNDTPVPASTSDLKMLISSKDACSSTEMNESSANIHFHGANISPICKQDNVLHTLVNSGESFTYTVQFPKDEPPGLYWYHPHVHGISESAVLGGASGALIIDGMENEQTEVAGLPEQILILRDNLVPGNPTPGGLIPSWDLSLNYIPVPYPDYPPALIAMKNNEKQFWRVVNAGADSILDLQLEYDGISQALRVVALDGVAADSQDGEKAGIPVMKTHILLPPAARAEFIVTGPKPSVQSARLTTQKVDTGPDGDNDPTRVIASIRTDQAASLRTMPAVSVKSVSKRFQGLVNETPVRTRQLYFSEVLSNPNDPNSPTNFYITEEGATPTLFDVNNAPAISVNQGTTEDWIVSNRARENHVFHIHQIHFLLLEQNGVAVSSELSQFLDTIQVPYWSGSGPYPSVKLRMDFRGPDEGDFVYHCHILGHEDSGMMATLRVLPPSSK